MHLPFIIYDLNFRFIIEEDKFAARPTHALGAGHGPGVGAQHLHLLLRRALPPLVVAGMLIKVCQPHDFVLLALALEQDDSLPVVLNGK